VARKRRQTIRSAGVVMLRFDQAEVRVLLVRRRRQDDWTLPKGRVRRGENWRAAARREAWEEAAVRFGDSRRLVEIAWCDRRGRTRRIRYWRSTRLKACDFQPTTEIAESAWLCRSEAEARVSSLRDRRAIRRAVKGVLVAGK